MRDVDPLDEKQVADAARLHRELFAAIGPIAAMGQRILRRICYGVLIRDGLMGAALCEVDGEPAGLVAYTTDSRAVHEAPTARYLPLVVRETLLSLLFEPRMLLGLPSAAKLLLDRHHEGAGGTLRVAETLALGVLPPYRGAEFVRRTGVRVADRLLERAMCYFRDHGVRMARGIVLADNLPALAFFRMRASRIEPFPGAEKPSYQVWFDVDALLGRRRPSSAPA